MEKEDKEIGTKQGSGHHTNLEELNQGAGT